MVSYKVRLSALFVASALALCSIGAQADNSQQDKMKSCNADATAKSLTGDDRKAFMKTCLSAKPAAASSTATGNSQQQKMKTCNADATSQKLTGDARKSFMKTCLSGSSSGATTSAPAAAPAPAGGAPATK